MSNIWSLFWGPSFVVKKALCHHSQEAVEEAIIRELQMHLDEMTPEQLEKLIKLVIEDSDNDYF